MENRVHLRGNRVKEPLRSLISPLERAPRFICGACGGDAIELLVAGRMLAVGCGNCGNLRELASIDNVIKAIEDGTS